MSEKRCGYHCQHGCGQPVLRGGHTGADPPDPRRQGGYGGRCQTDRRYGAFLLYEEEAPASGELGCEARLKHGYPGCAQRISRHDARHGYAHQRGQRLHLHTGNDRAGRAGEDRRHKRSYSHQSAAETFQIIQRRVGVCQEIDRDNPQGIYDVPAVKGIHIHQYPADSDRAWHRIALSVFPFFTGRNRTCAVADPGVHTHHNRISDFYDRARVGSDGIQQAHPGGHAVSCQADGV